MEVDVVVTVAVVAHQKLRAKGRAAGEEAACTYCDQRKQITKKGKQRRVVG